MTVLLTTALLSVAVFNGDAFLPTPSSVIPKPPVSSNNCARHKNSQRRNIRTSNSRLRGIQEWRDEALDSNGTLDGDVPADLPVLPFPFSDILLQGQRTQLNLYEQRFHDLFQDVVDNHAGMVGMGLLAGRGMVTTLPLCEVELFTRFGAEEEWVDRGDGLGNGSIFVTLRAVGRAKIVEELLQEEPYMKARVVEVFDEDAATPGAEDGNGEAAARVAGNIEDLLASLASMEHKLREMEGGKGAGQGREADASGPGDAGSEETGDGAMSRRLVNARLESLFTKDSVEGVDMESTKGDTRVDGDEDEDDVDDEDEAIEGETGDEQLDHMAQYRKAFDNAKEADTFGYVLRPDSAVDDVSGENEANEQRAAAAARTPKDLTAISWAAFCTGAADNIQRDVVKIRALDTVNVLQRLQLAAAMLGEESKKLKAKLALVGIKNIMDEEL